MQPVFIGGLGRSGTTLLADVLGFHPAVSPIYETDFVVAVMQLVFASERPPDVQARIRTLMDGWTRTLPHRPDNKRPYERFVHGPHHILFTRDVALERTEALLREIGRSPVQAVRGFVTDLFAEHCRLADRPRWVNKTPLYLQWASPMRVVFPDMLFVHIVRDGRDVAASAVSRTWGPATPTQGAAWWARGVHVGHAFADQNPGHYVEVRYEDLLREPLAALKPVFHAMGLDTPQDLIERYAAAGGRFDPSRIGGHWSTFTPEDHAGFWRIAGAALTRCGYSREGDLVA